VAYRQSDTVLCSFVRWSGLSLFASGAGSMISWIPLEVRWLVRHVRPFFLWHLASFSCITAGSVLALLAPLVLKWLIDVILPGRHKGLLIVSVGLIFLCHQGRAMLTSVGGYLTTLAAERLALSMRMLVLRHLGTLSADYHERNPVGTSMYPLKGPIDEISYFGSDLLPSILRTLMATGLTLGIMLILDARMALAVLPVIPVFLLARKHFRRRLEAGSDTVQCNHIAWSTFLQEHLSSIVALQLLRQERRRERKAFHLLGTTIRSYHQLCRTGVSFTFYTSLTIGLGMSAVIGLGGWRVLTGSLTVGGLVAFYTYVTQLFEPLSSAAETYVRAQKTFASVRQVQAVLAMEPSIRVCPTAIRFPQNVPWMIDLVDVRFGYPRNRSLLLSIPRLNIGAGEHVAIVGENGAGKSTLAKLLARLYDVDSGSIFFAGHDVRKFDIDSLREHVCYAPPHPILFDTTLAGNLRLGKVAASDAELEKVVEDVGLKAWMSTLEGGLNQRIGPGGSRLSGGRRQRLGIARAILQRPYILILDEATSSLDAASEQQMLWALAKVLPGSTIVVISHRLSALRCVGRVIVLEDGCVVEDASPALLLRNGTAYSRLFNTSVSTPGYRHTTVNG
jgi:ABC-type multidrug transport system fused ATPase/permease subunit